MILILAPILMGALSFWKVFENDIFWQIRAGEEILRGLPVQMVDTWSTTAYLKPWFNFQWISTVIFAFVADLSSQKYHYLPLFRSMIVALDFVLILNFLSRLCSQQFQRVFVQLLLLPAIYIVISGRLQLRPDIFGLTFFLLLNLLWSSRLSFHTKAISSVATLVAWSNFHGGTVPFGIAYCSLQVLFGASSPRPLNSRSAVFLILFLATWLATPIGTGVLHVLGNLTVAYDWKLGGNPDEQPFSLSLLNPETSGSIFILWLIFNFFALTALTGKIVTERFSKRSLFWILGLIFFSAVTLSRVRARAYDTIFIAPLCVEGLLAALSSKKFQLAAVTLSGVLWLWLLPAHMDNAPSYGFGINEGKYPVAAAAFIRRHRPSKELFNFYDFGGYLIEELPDYRVSIDSREIPFLKELEERRAIGDDPEKFQSYLAARGFNLVLAKNVGPTSGLPKLLPVERWAKVFDDPVAVIYAKRLPENQLVIQTSERH